MSDQVISEALREADPARGQVPEGLDGRAEQDLSRILQTARRPRRRWRLAVVGIASFVAAAMFVAQPWVTDSRSGGGAQAATPPLLKFQLKDKRPARQQLLDFASRVRALPAEPATGPVLQISMKGWYLVSGDVTEDYIEPHVVTNYVSDGRLRSFEPGRDPGDAVSVFWKEGLSVDPSVLKKQLAVAHPGDGVDSFLNALDDLQREAIPSPVVRAALLTLLADEKDITADGEVIDRSGRRGIGFSVLTDGGGLPTKRTLIFDPVTGSVLGQEQMLTETAGKMNVPIPSVIEYESYLSRSYVAEIPK
jgi:hypothetical protein